MDARDLFLLERSDEFNFKEAFFERCSRRMFLVIDVWTRGSSWLAVAILLKTTAAFKFNMLIVFVTTETVHFFLRLREKELVTSTASGDRVRVVLNTRVRRSIAQAKPTIREITNETSDQRKQKDRMPGQKRAADPSVASTSDAKKSKHEGDLLQISQVQRFQLLFRAYQADAEVAASSSSRSSSDTTLLGPAGMPYLPYEGTRLKAVLDDWAQQLTRFKEADNGAKKLAPQVHAQLVAFTVAVGVLLALYCGAAAGESAPPENIAFENLLADLRPEPQSERISSAEDAAKEFEDWLAVPLQQCEDILPPHGKGKESRMRWQSHFLAELACETARSCSADVGKHMEPLCRSLIRSVRDSGQDTCACCRVFDMDATDDDICAPAFLGFGLLSPPVVVPACGHAVCTECFEKLAIDPVSDAGRRRGFGGCCISCKAAYDWSGGMLFNLVDIVAAQHSFSSVFNYGSEFKEDNRATETANFAAAVLHSLLATGLDKMQFQEDIEETGEHGGVLSVAKYVMEKVWSFTESRLELEDACSAPPQEWREAAVLHVSTVERAAELILEPSEDEDGSEGDEDEDADEELGEDDEDADDEEEDDEDADEEDADDEDADDEDADAEDADDEEQDDEET